MADLVFHKTGRRLRRRTLLFGVSGFSYLFANNGRIRQGVVKSSLSIRPSMVLFWHSVCRRRLPSCLSADRLFRGADIIRFVPCVLVGILISSLEIGQKACAEN